MQNCPRGSRQHCIRKNLVQCCLNTSGATLHRSKPFAMLSERLWNVVLILLGHLCTRKTLCNIVPEAPDNIAQEKVLFNVVLKLLHMSHCHMGQHCTCQNPMQSCLRGCRQLCTRKSMFNVVLTLLGQYCTGQNPMKDCPRDSS